MCADITITIVKGTDAGESITLSKGDCATIGRHETSDFTVSDFWMSRRHFRIEYVGNSWVMSDLRSTHGTLVNEEKVMVKMLESKDFIFAGSTSFCVTLGNDKPIIEPNTNSKSARFGNRLRSLSGISGEKTLGDSGEKTLGEF